MKLRFNFLKLSQLESLLAGDIKESEIQVYFLFDCSYEFRNMLCFLCFFLHDDLLKLIYR